MPISHRILTQNPIRQPHQPLLREDSVSKFRSHKGDNQGHHIAVSSNPSGITNWIQQRRRICQSIQCSIHTSMRIFPCVQFPINILYSQ
uniref:AlNc14C158G7710 protein n=1 Tax=Albugo laibachii Nc14 TaxID=890382 RepID=F0WMM4_9STRA|nr:AlNc14C158G7710 [Albugo laibachii Nc14]|eukprot:CCA22556.1 AlNc14C158G7710 [Albugo laibachii Nc14]